MDSHLHPDPLLVRLLQEVNKGGFSTPVILHLEAMTVQGELMGFAEYQSAMEEFVMLESEFRDNQVMAQVKEGFANLLHDQAGDALAHLHLKDVTIYHAGQSFKVDWWRGRLSQVESFSVYKKSASSSLR